jgi:acetyltransferase-like isoleucine patch superfamily enzyme
MKTKKKIPYYQIQSNLTSQISNSSQKRKTTMIKFIVKKLKNYIFGMLAYNCPVNSWRIKLHRMRGVHIGKNVYIGLRCTLDHSYPEYIYIGDNAGLNGDVYLLAHTNPNESYKDIFNAEVTPIVIGENAWICIRATILPGVRIGNNAVVSAGSVVNKDVPDNTLLAAAKNRRIKICN